MLAIFEPLRQFDLLAIALRMVTAVICGGVIGIERAFKSRPAGFRTHILICLGASMATLTSQYLVFEMHYFTDLGRLGAQVVAGIGFIGAGSIIVTRRHRVKGLTTAAGLWTSAIVGLCCGAGYCEGALLATALILTAELVFSKIEYRMLAASHEATLCVGFTSKNALDRLIHYVRDVDVLITDMTIHRSEGEDEPHSSVVFTMQMTRRLDYGKFLEGLVRLPGVITVEEL